MDRPGRPNVVVSLDVAAASEMLGTEPVDWLFIRINCWDDYQHIAAANKNLAPKVVFLSGWAEKCTEHLAFTLDAHLQAPYRAGRLSKVLKRLSALDFTPRLLDFFFIKTHARFIPVRYCDLHQVRRIGWTLWIETRQTEYRVTGSLSAFQARLPIPLARVRRGLLVNEAYDADPNKIEPTYPRPWLP
jgi:DNA-binding LytR/AlgR family response regulator